MLLLLKDQFISHYGSSQEDTSFFFAPGRVNLIGEHTDYNGGYVLPCSLTFGTYLGIRKSGHDVFRFSSANLPEKFSVHNDESFQKIPGAWVNYPLGVIDQFYKDGKTFPGFEMHFIGDIPAGAGLSSSASLEMVTATALNTIFSLGYSLTDLAKLCQRAENEFVGMNCGIMDQFTSALGKAGHALFLNCKTLNFVEVPFHLGDHALVIVNTNKKRGLVDSKYNERRAECELALRQLQQYKPWNFLGEVSVEDFDKAEQYIEDDLIAKRAFHVIAEDKRVLEAAKALHLKNLDYFGKLMVASHESLKTLYEVSCYELDVLVDTALSVKGVLGSRMTGGGFGGCTVNLMRKDAVEHFTETTRITYHEKTGLNADFYLPDIGDGAHRLE